MKFSQKVRIGSREVIVMVHNVESREEAISLLEKAQPLNGNDIKEYEGTEFLHLNSGLGYGKKLAFTEDADKAGASTSCTGEWV